MGNPPPVRAYNVQARRVRRDVASRHSESGHGTRSLADVWADTTTPHGRLMFTFLGGLAEFERELIRTRTGEGRARLRPVGFIWVDRQSLPLIKSARPTPGSKAPRPTSWRTWQKERFATIQPIPRAGVPGCRPSNGFSCKRRVGVRQWPGYCDRRRPDERIPRLVGDGGRAPKCRSASEMRRRRCERNSRPTSEGRDHLRRTSRLGDDSKHALAVSFVCYGRPARNRPV